MVKLSGVWFETVVKGDVGNVEPDEYPKVKVHASCGCYVGAAKWKQGLHDWYKEPDECNWEDVVLLDKEDWEDETASMECPKCGAELTQDMEHFELINE
ncbi:hypothetical protein FT641_19315 [Bacillus paranthracis]|uniref:hypothetical protein n=1 Tax=Bacillus paranthracis TaxID=2026186 RepID=UPI00187AB2F0|nr:hypothetical protein [Bacillus paranthracis]MBE7114285.1 hypothetical protein [Bacillus paranthracis]MBE7154842.1 hypothetical protein [Bacillus paranthracis]